jgi:hypothetical protein
LKKWGAEIITPFLLNFVFIEANYLVLHEKLTVAFRLELSQQWTSTQQRRSGRRGADSQGGLVDEKKAITI